MNKKEKMLFLELCKFKNANQEKMRELVQDGAATPEVLGELFNNRMSAVAYGVLYKTELLDKVNREFRNALGNSYGQNVIRNNGYIKSLSYLTEILKPVEGKYALLKGAYLCAWYPRGYRTSNDIDVLTEPKNVTEISKVLTTAGFKQGYLKNNSFIPASREDIISSKMMRGETVPFIKNVNLPFMKYLEVDINYSLSYKNEKETLVSELLANVKRELVKGIEINTLSKYDFLIHLCEHLYKEATTYPWIKMKRDMTLYKFCDIYALLSEYEKYDFTKLKERIDSLTLKGVCYYAIYAAQRIFKMEQTDLNEFLMEIAPESMDVLYDVINPEEKKMYKYEMELEERLFKKDRAILLKEVTK